MIELGLCDESEMVLAFLRSETSGSSHSNFYDENIRAGGSDRESLIVRANLTNAAENAERRALLRHARGGLFANFPSDVQWRTVEIEQSDFQRLMYLNHGAWLPISNNSRHVTDVNWDRLHTNDEIASKVKSIIEAIHDGRPLEPLIGIAAEDGNLILIEGNHRATAYVLQNFDRPISMILGRSDQMRGWRFY